MEEGNKYIMQCSPADSNSVEKMARKKGSELKRRFLLEHKRLDPIKLFYTDLSDISIYT